MTYYIVNFRGINDLDSLILEWRKWLNVWDISVNINQFIRSPFSDQISPILFNRYGSFNEELFLKAVRFSGIIKHDTCIKIYYDGFECSLNRFLAQLDELGLNDFLFNLDDYI